MGTFCLKTRVLGSVVGVAIVVGGLFAPAVSLVAQARPSADTSCAVGGACPVAVTQATYTAPHNGKQLIPVQFPSPCTGVCPAGLQIKVRANSQGGTYRHSIQPNDTITINWYSDGTFTVMVSCATGPLTDWSKSPFRFTIAPAHLVLQRYDNGQWHNVPFLITLPGIYRFLRVH
jgi:hypothetical protein